MRGVRPRPATTATARDNDVVAFVSRRWWLWASVGVIALVPIQIGFRRIWPSIDDSDPPPGFELQLAAIAVLALAALPHVVAVLGYRGRPWLLRIASTLAFVYTMISVVSPFLLLAAVPLFLIPGVVYPVYSTFHTCRNQPPRSLRFLDVG